MSRTDPACFPEAQKWRLLTPEEIAAHNERVKTSRRACIKEINLFLKSRGVDVRIKSFRDVNEYIAGLPAGLCMSNEDREMHIRLGEINTRHAYNGNRRF